MNPRGGRVGEYIWVINRASNLIKSGGGGMGHLQCLPLGLVVMRALVGGRAPPPPLPQWWLDLIIRDTFIGSAGNRGNREFSLYGLESRTRRSLGQTHSLSEQSRRGRRRGPSVVRFAKHTRHISETALTPIFPRQSIGREGLAPHPSGGAQHHTHAKCTALSH